MLCLFTIETFIKIDGLFLLFFKKKNRTVIYSYAAYSKTNSLQLKKKASLYSQKKKGRLISVLAEGNLIIQTWAESQEQRLNEDTEHIRYLGS